MKNTINIFALALIVIAIAGSTSWARRIENWSYDRLLKEADLVVIAAAVSSEECKDQWSEPLFEKDRFQGIETTFKVWSALKGTAPDSTLKLLHFQYKARESNIFNDGPSLVSFIIKPLSLSISLRPEEIPHKVESSPPQYLLFLKKREDGRYEAASGQTDPSFSVRAMFDTNLFN